MMMTMMMKMIMIMMMMMVVIMMKMQLLIIMVVMVMMMILMMITRMCDQTLELINDLIQEVVKYFFEKDEERKKEVGKHLAEVVYPKFLGYFEKQLDNNGGKYLVGSGLTVADLAVYAVLDTAMQNSETFLEKHEKLRAHRDMVGAIPKIQEYVSNRKKTDI
ncbi:hypothetical protein DPMN_017406 [Dreissena polymorpha]|uniref:GST C-terminal domain-containing protein n=2 Tax=Dreissena polymorpha TaxID=45954 RepID=A0A9D4NF57_DREPO|nr:hypothetical protein DPMN_017406 [Dreissena polymorpha]